MDSYRTLVEAPISSIDWDVKTFKKLSDLVEQLSEEGGLEYGRAKNRFEAVLGSSEELLDVDRWFGFGSH